MRIVVTIGPTMVPVIDTAKAIHAAVALQSIGCIIIIPFVNLIERLYQILEMRTRREGDDVS